MNQTPESDISPDWVGNSTVITTVGEKNIRNGKTRLSLVWLKSGTSVMYQKVFDSDGSGLSSGDECDFLFPVATTAAEAVYLLSEGEPQHSRGVRFENGLSFTFAQELGRVNTTSPSGSPVVWLAGHRHEGRK